MHSVEIVQTVLPHHQDHAKFLRIKYAILQTQMVHVLQLHQNAKAQPCMFVILDHAQYQILEHIQASRPVNLPAQQPQNMHVSQDHAQHQVLELKLKQRVNLPVEIHPQNMHVFQEHVHNQIVEHIVRQIVKHHVQLLLHQVKLSEHTTLIGLIIAKLHTHMILLTLHLLWTKLTIFTMDFHTFAHHPVGRLLLTG